MELDMPLIKNILATAFFPALLAFIKSELMALDSTTTASGIIQFFRQAKVVNKQPQTEKENYMEDFLKQLEGFATKLEELGPRVETGLDRLAKTIEVAGPIIARFAPMFGKDGQAIAAGATLATQIAQGVDAAIPDQPAG